MARRRKPPTDKQVEQSDKIFGLLFEEDELTWQNVIYDMINAEQMNPWDIDVSLIAKNFIKNLRKLKEMNFRISGKMVLAAALLLKIKSNRLLQEDITMLDNLLAGAEEPMDLLAELQDIAMGAEKAKEDLNKPKIYPRTPQPRKRKVSVYDLVEALERLWM